MSEDFQDWRAVGQIVTELTRNHFGVHFYTLSDGGLFSGDLIDWTVAAQASYVNADGEIHLSESGSTQIVYRGDEPMRLLSLARVMRKRARLLRAGWFLVEGPEPPPMLVVDSP